MIWNNYFWLLEPQGVVKPLTQSLSLRITAKQSLIFLLGIYSGLRALKKTERGLLIEKFTSQGELVPLEIVVETILSAIKSSSKGIILIDGYPRSVEQMQALDKELNAQNEVILKSVIEVEVSENTAKERVLGRSRGADDNEKVFHNRMRVFLDPLVEIQNFYKNKKVYKAINGERSIEEIVNEMQKYILSFAN